MLPAHADNFLGTTPLFHGVHDNANSVVDEGSLTLAESALSPPGSV